MKLDMDYTDYVDKYLDNVLEDKERTQFERELNYDMDLKEELELQKKIEAMLSDEGTLDLKKKLDAIYAEEYQPWTKTFIPKIKANRKTFLKVASIAAAASFAIFSITTFTELGNPSTDAIFSKNYETADMSMSFRSAADQVDSDLRSAMLHYEHAEYQEAITLFEKVLDVDNSRVGLNLYSGISKMEIAEYEEANNDFKKVIAHKTNAFVESAEWYLGLSYLKMDELEKAKVVFNEIISRDGYFKKDAKRILRKIK